MNLWDSRSVADRYADYRPGFELLACEEAGLPMYWMTLDAVVLEHQPVPVMSEFVLRALLVGFSDRVELGGFLGLEQDLLDTTLSELFRLDQIDYPAGPDGARSLKITDLGRQTLETLEETQPARTEIGFAFDRLLWKPTPQHVSQLLKPKEVADADIRELRPRRVARPTPDQLDLVEISSTLDRLWSKKAPRVLAVRHVLRAERRYIPGHLLVFQSESGDDTEVTVAIDGHVSESHENALTSLGGAEFLRVESKAAAPEIVDISDAVGTKDEASIPSSVVSLEEVRELRRSTHTHGDATTSAPTRPEPPTADEIAATRQSVESIPAREIDTYEHAQFFKEARRLSKRRLLVISPWVSGSVVNKAFVDELRRLAGRRVQIHVGYGIDKDQPSDPRNQFAEERLHELGNRYENVTVARLGDTHAKVLISDSTVIVSSFNWLSFRGDAGRTYRQERGVLLKDPSFADQSYEFHRNRIEASLT